MALYAHYRMIYASFEALTALRDGVHDVIDPAALTGLSAEDFRLLLNGCPNIDLAQLKACTRFEGWSSAPLWDHHHHHGVIMESSSSSSFPFFIVIIKRLK